MYVWTAMCCNVCMSRRDVSLSVSKEGFFVLSGFHLACCMYGRMYSTVPYRSSAWQEAGPHPDGRSRMLELGSGPSGAGSSGCREIGLVGGRRRQKVKGKVKVRSR